LGFVGAKDHSYRDVKGNIQLAKELRAASATLAGNPLMRRLF
jgi:hypothetical protein